ncbi:EEF1A lysine methyltransferase 2-like [Oppia nitens]|uniref:EEF1A lysine methyltransferase 2-like n=1 Tax=Oppia nitens TaxID=1686743 RepID=UPI0023DB589A|nr:EEF1A lysine methyltransferase 2-like [Oppia nitens]
MSSSGSDEDTISGSVIGTKDYWNEWYERELKNFEEFEDSGDVWFGRKNNQRIVQWICRHLTTTDDDNKQQSKILDIGCGNGYMLLELAKHGYRRLVGIDYSSTSIDLCRRLLAANELANKVADICFEVYDILGDNDNDNSSRRSANSCLIGQTFDCLVDKGTYDAVCLQPGVQLDDIRHKYRCFLQNLMTSESVFIIMSCNFTKTELIRDLRVVDDSGGGGGGGSVDHNNQYCFRLVDEIPTPTITFGGRSGSQVTALILKKSIVV